MQIGEHEVEFVEKLSADPWWDLWGEVNSIRPDEDGRFNPFRQWEWSFIKRFLVAAVDKLDGEDFDDASALPLPLTNAVVLAAYAHVVELFLSSQQSLESASD